MTDHERVRGAVDDLEDAVTGLCGPRTTRAAGNWVTRPSRYQELRDDLEGQQGSNGHSARSMPPLWIDAAALLAEIDRDARSWFPAHGKTPERLNGLCGHEWRPQDVPQIAKIAKIIRRWCDRVDELVAPRRRWEVMAPCPDCGRSVVYRQDSAEDFVKVPALVLTTDGCECLNCHAFWDPPRFMFLAHLLGFKAPEGMLNTP